MTYFDASVVKVQQNCQYPPYLTVQTNLYTFPLRISWENLIKDQGIFSLVIISLILTTFTLVNFWDLKG